LAKLTPGFFTQPTMFELNIWTSVAPLAQVRVTAERFTAISSP
jgi:hypothetical protein